ncbi:MAG: C40 family peptidase [Betaproteobacteria bacterium]|nr:C40 family peptidase [Betaproteobacteria bacterium]
MTFSPKFPFLLTVLLCLSLAARAEPDATAITTPGPDPVLQLLQDKGLLAGSQQVAARIEASPLVQQMRDRATEMVMASMNFLGVRYVRGGNDAEQGFDCSGFTRYVFEHSLGLVLPRRADEQARQAGLLSVARSELKPGDLVFFDTMRRAFSHVGIYVGEGKFIHAPRSGAEVRIEDMHQAYWSKRFNGARRAEIAPATTLAPN